MESIENTGKEVEPHETEMFFNYSFILMCICLGHLSPLPPSSTLSPLPHLLSPPPSLPGRTCSALISNFVEEKTQA
jgi:hypothetical protein